MTQYAKSDEEEPSVTELLELSVLYNSLIIDLADLWNVELTPDLRSRAFQLIKEAGEQVKMKTLAASVVANLKRNDDVS